MADAVIAALLTVPGGCYVDATFGRGGHARRVLAALNAQGRLMVLDRDPTAMIAARALADTDARCTAVRSAFSQLGALLQARLWQGKVNGIFLDLGVSSPQLDDAERGFSFMRDGPLDMRMDPSAGESAAQWLARVDEPALTQVLWDYGEERYARKIARAVLQAQQVSPLTSTRQLAEVVARAAPRREFDQHPATRTFQAIRIMLNDELGELTRILPQALAALAPSGRLVVLSFHSLEDRIVKHFMQAQSQSQAPLGLPLRAAEMPPPLMRIVQSSVPDAEEVRLNPRARSARLRVAERLVA
jgi:16S rRNA (cytosine1402-N4)-methyltransferase